MIIKKASSSNRSRSSTGVPKGTGRKGSSSGSPAAKGRARQGGTTGGFSKKVSTKSSAPKRTALREAPQSAGSGNSSARSSFSKSPASSGAASRSSGSKSFGSKNSLSRSGSAKASSRGKSVRPLRPSKPLKRFPPRIREMEELEKSLELGQRLQIILAAAGYGSRRNCEELITSGRVQIDDEVVNQLGARVFPLKQKIKVDGELLTRSRPAYVVIYKPKGVLCTNYDPDGRKRAIDYVPEKYGRLFAVGRLDQASEGLLLLTNDGLLAQRLTHPRYEVAKKYKVQVAGFVESDLINQLKKGIHLAEAVVQADEVVFKARYKNSSILEIVLREGKNREIRRMLARLGHKVLQLQRTAIGPVKLASMIPGEYRELTKAEVKKLYEAAGLPVK